MNRLLMVPIIAIFFLCSCATTRPTQSYVDSAITTNDAQVLSRDTADYLANLLPPARTTLILDPPGRMSHDSLTITMLAALRNRGYGVTIINSKSNLSGSEGVHLRYLVSPLDGGVLLRLQYQDIESTRFYPRGTDCRILMGTPFMVRGDEK
ncbi:MAG: conjugal transfer protein TrbH [Gammaproteobacteria bacterium]